MIVDWGDNFLFRFSFEFYGINVCVSIIKSRFIVFGAFFEHPTEKLDFRAHFLAIFAVGQLFGNFVKLFYL